MEIGSTNLGSRLPLSITQDGRSQLISKELCWKGHLSRELKSKKENVIGFNVGYKIVCGRAEAVRVICMIFWIFFDVGRNCIEPQVELVQGADRVFSGVRAVETRRSE
jgi:hypothetical protein